MRPKKQKTITFVNRCGCVVDENILRDAVLWFAEGGTVFQKKTISMHGRYPCVSVYKRKIHIHRLIWIYENRKIIDRSIHIHHLDGDRMNAMSSNLEAISASEHMSQHNKGKTLTDDHKRKISLANSRRRGSKGKKTVSVDLVILKQLLDKKTSVNKCAEYFSCDWTTIKSRINENPELLEK